MGHGHTSYCTHTDRVYMLQSYTACCKPTSHDHITSLYTYWPKSQHLVHTCCLALSRESRACNRASVCLSLLKPIYKAAALIHTVRGRRKRRLEGQGRNKLLRRRNRTPLTVQTGTDSAARTKGPKLRTRSCGGTQRPKSHP